MIKNRRDAAKSAVLGVSPMSNFSRKRARRKKKIKNLNNSDTSENDIKKTLHSSAFNFALLCFKNI
jgi:hypothetical protein